MEDTQIFYSSAGQRVPRCYLMRFESSRSDRRVRAQKAKISTAFHGRNGRKAVRGQRYAAGRCKSRGLHSSASHNACERGLGFRVRFFCFKKPGLVPWPVRTRVTAPRPGPPGASTSPESGTAVCDWVQKGVKKKTQDNEENLVCGLFVVVWFQDTQRKKKFGFGI
jgi:hypothetical protein